MNKQQQELYDKLLKKVNEYCLGAAAEDVIAAIDALVDTYENPKFDSESKPLQAFEDLFSGVKFSSADIDFNELYEIVETELKDAEKYKKALEIIRNHKLLNYVLRNPKCAEMYHLSEEEIKKLEFLKGSKRKSKKRGIKNESIN